MNPFAVLLGIIMGSMVAIAVSLAMTAMVFLLLPEYSARLASEHAPLLRGLAWSWSLAALAAGSFIGELRAGRWRRPCQIVLFALLAVLAWHYWPRQSSTAVTGPRGLGSFAEAAVVGIDSSVVRAQRKPGRDQRGLDVGHYASALAGNAALSFVASFPAVDIVAGAIKWHWQ